MDEPTLAVIELDGGCVSSKELASFATHHFYHGLLVQLPSQRLAHVVDDGQFGSPLSTLLQKAIGLIEKARVFQGDAHAGREGAQKTHVPFVVAVHRPILHGNDAGDLFADKNRHTQPGLGFSPTAVGNVDRTEVDHVLECVNDERLT